MIIGDHNPQFFTQEFALLLLQDSHPQVKVNNINLWIYYGDLSLLKNDRLLYFGYWSVHWDTEQSPSIWAEYLGAKMQFVESGLSAGQTKTWFKWIGPASFWDSTPDSPPPMGTFWGFRYEIDNVPAPANMPSPEPSGSVEKFWFVVDDKRLFAKAVVSGADRIFCSFYVDTEFDTCYPLEISDLLLTDNQMVIVHPAKAPCTSQGNPVVHELIYPDYYGVNLRFMNYVENPPFYMGYTLARYEIMQESTDLYFDPSTFQTVGTGSTKSIDGNILTVRVLNENVEFWTDIKWKVSSSPSVSSSVFVHEFTRPKGFTPLNQIQAKWGTPSCSSPAKWVYMEKPNTGLSIGKRVFITSDPTIYFPPEITEIVDPFVNTRFQLLKEQRVGDDRPYNYVGVVLGMC